MKVLFLVLYPINLLGQSPNTAYNHNQYSLGSEIFVSKLIADSEKKLLKSPPTLNFNCMLEYQLAIKNFFSIGSGIAIDYRRYKVVPTNKEYALDYSTSRTYSLSIPVYVYKVYPFNSKTGLYVKTGFSISKTFSSLAGFGSYSINNMRLYDTYATFKKTPQIGILFELGETFVLKNNNYFTLGIVINQYFVNSIRVNYEYMPDNEDLFSSGSFNSNASTYGVSLKYHFKRFSNDKN